MSGKWARNRRKSDRLLRGGRIQSCSVPVAAAVAAVIMIAFTLAINVPINKRTLTWNPEHPPEGWQTDRQRWHTYQGVRALLLGMWFLCAATAVTLT